MPEVIFVENLTASVQVVTSLTASVEVVSGTQSESDMASGFIYVADILPSTADDAVSGKTYQDAESTVLQSAVVSNLTVDLLVRSSYPVVKIGGAEFELEQLDGGTYEGEVTATLVAGTNRIYVVTPDNLDGPFDTITITHTPAPTVLTLAFTGGYPIGPTAVLQTQVKAGDAFSITGTTNVTATAIDILDFGAFAASLEVIVSGTTFTVVGTVADRGGATQALAARVRARNAAGAYGATRDTDTGGGTVDGVNLINLNNTIPTNALGAVTYPGAQGAIKDGEVATVAHVASDFDIMAYSSPGSQLDIPSPSVHANPKSVSRIDGNYNVATENLTATATRLANGAQTISSIVVRIAHAAAVITVTEAAARLRSGGNNGTSVQSHVITITSDQILSAAPTLDPDQGGARGTFSGVFAGGPTTWTADLQVHDDDEKGTFTWEGLSATNLAGVVTAVIDTSGGNNDTYVLGGFVARDLTFAAFDDEASIGTQVVDFTKLTAGIVTATAETALKQPIATSPPVTDGYTIDAVLVNPTSLIWLDTAAVNANATGTAQITAVEETV